MRVMLDRGAYMPERAHSLDAGYDLRTPRAVTVLPYESVFVYSALTPSAAHSSMRRIRASG